MRTIIEEAVATTEEGQDRLDRARNRLDARTAEILQEMAEAPTVSKDVWVEEEQVEVKAQPGQGEIPQEPDASHQQMGNKEGDGWREAPMPVSDV